MTGDHRRRVGDQFLRLIRSEGRRSRDDVETEAEPRSPVQGNDMGFGCILDRQPAVEEFVRLDVGSGQMPVGVILLREEAAGAKDDDIEPILAVEQCTDLLGGAFGHSVDALNHAAFVAPPALPARIDSEIISEVVEVKTKRSWPAASAASSRLSVPVTLTSTKA